MTQWFLQGKLPRKCGRIWIINIVFISLHFELKFCLRNIYFYNLKIWRNEIDEKSYLWKLHFYRTIPGRILRYLFVKMRKQDISKLIYSSYYVYRIWEIFFSKVRIWKVWNSNRMFCNNGFISMCLKLFEQET